MSTNQDYPYEWKKKRRFGLKEVLLSLGVLVVIIAAANIIPKLGSQESAAPTPTPSYIERGTRKIPSVVPVDVEFPAPKLQMSDLEGTPVSLADYRGQVVLLNNWMIDCPFCEAEMPEFEAFYNSHKSQGFTIVAVNGDDPVEDVQAYVQNMAITFPVLSDPKRQSIHAFRNTNLPNSYVIDKAGTVRLSWTGPISLGILEEFVTPLLQE
jgi:peroxiredoxin